MKHNRQIRTLLSLVLLISLLTAVFAVPAFAAEERAASVGENFGIYGYVSNTTLTITNAHFEGNPPPGANILIRPAEWFCVSGTAQQQAVYDFTVVVDWSNGEITRHDYRLTVNPGSMTRDTIYDTVTQGVLFDKTYRIGTGGNIHNQGVDGQLPSGLSATYNSDSIRISGTPTQSGTYQVTLICYDEYSGQNIRQPVVFTVNAGMLQITKSPTGETVKEGDSAWFIAKAENETDVRWSLVSPNNSETLDMTYAGGRFAGLGYEAYVDEHTYSLQLTNIPLSLNGWKVVASFYGNGGPMNTNQAMVTVQERTVTPPTIQTHPKSNELNYEPGKAVTLNVTATADGGRITYQWYKNTVNSTANGQAIAGATTPSYTTEQIVGTTYYYCVLQTVNNQISSPSVTTSIATVTYKNPNATPSPSPTPATPTPTPTVTPVLNPNGVVTTPDTNSGTGNSGNSSGVSGETVVTPAPTRNSGNKTSNPTDSSLRKYFVLLVLCLIALAGIGAACAILNAKNNRSGKRRY